MFNIFILIIILFSSCSEAPLIDNYAQDEEMVELCFKVDRAMPTFLTKADKKPMFDHLYVLVFDENAYFVEYAKAKYVEDKKKYKIELHTTDEKRILHFIASNKSLNDLVESSNLGFTTSDILLMNEHMTTSDGDCAYWQRVELPNISGNMSIKPVQLVSNQAEIMVEIDDNVKNFDFEGFVVVNQPDKGSIVPYRQGGESNYPNFESPLEYAKINYKGYMPKGTSLLNRIPNKNKELKFFKNEEVVKVYEYPFIDGNSNNMFVVIKGKYHEEEKDKGEPCYYKLDIIRAPKEGEFKTSPYNIIRNFRYILQINKIQGKGGTDLVDVATHAASNNILGSVSVEDVNNILFHDRRMSVSYSVKSLLRSAAGQEVSLGYQYYSKYSEKKQANDKVKIYCDDYNIFSKGQIDQLNEGFSKLNPQGEDNGWSYINLKQDVDSEKGDKELRIQDLYIVSDDEGSKGDRIYRRVRFKLQDNILMKDITINNFKSEELICYNMNGEPFEVRWTMPDNISKEMFPLKFYMESSRRNITPQEESGISFEYGQSFVDGRTDDSYFYVYTLEYDDYKKDKHCLAKMMLREIENDDENFKFDKNTPTFYIYNEYLGKQKFNFKLRDKEKITISDVSANNKTMKITLPALKGYVKDDNPPRWTITVQANRSKLDRIAFKNGEYKQEKDKVVDGNYINYIYSFEGDKKNDVDVTVEIYNKEGMENSVMEYVKVENKYAYTKDATFGKQIKWTYHTAKSNFSLFHINGEGTYQGFAVPCIDLKKNIYGSYYIGEYHERLVVYLTETNEDDIGKKDDLDAMVESITKPVVFENPDNEFIKADGGSNKRLAISNILIGGKEINKFYYKDIKALDGKTSIGGETKFFYYDDWNQLHRLKGCVDIVDIDKDIEFSPVIWYSWLKNKKLGIKTTVKWKYDVKSINASEFVKNRSFELYNPQIEDLVRFNWNVCMNDKNGKYYNTDIFGNVYIFYPGLNLSFKFDDIKEIIPEYLINRLEKFKRDVNGVSWVDIIFDKHIYKNKDEFLEKHNYILIDDLNK